MGLDNGIIIRSNKKISFPNELVVTNFENSDFNKTEYDICYWRKCWGLRGAILHDLESAYDYDYEFILNKTDLKSIWEIINDFNNKKKWNEYGESIWSYNEIRDSLDYNLLAIEWLIQNFDNIEGEIIFYDSY